MRMRPRGKMDCRLFLFFLFLGTVPISSGWAEGESILERGSHSVSRPVQEVVQGALQALKAVVDLWRDQKFDDLYELGTVQSRGQFSKEQFIELMKNSNKKLQCCWATMQDPQGFFESPTQVAVQAKLGYENFQNTKYATPDRDAESAQWVISSSFDSQTFLMVLQQERWRIDLTEILLASGYHQEGVGLTGMDGQASGFASDKP